MRWLLLALLVVCAGCAIADSVRAALYPDFVAIAKQAEAAALAKGATPEQVAAIVDAKVDEAIDTKIAGKVTEGVEGAATANAPKVIAALIGGLLLWSGKGRGYQMLKASGGGLVKLAPLVVGAIKNAGKPPEAPGGKGGGAAGATA